MLHVVELEFLRQCAAPGQLARHALKVAKEERRQLELLGVIRVEHLDRELLT